MVAIAIVIVITDTVTDKSNEFLKQLHDKGTNPPTTHWLVLSSSQHFHMTGSLTFPILQDRKGGSERACNLPTGAQLVSKRGRI